MGNDQSIDNGETSCGVAVREFHSRSQPAHRRYRGRMLAQLEDWHSLIGCDAPCKLSFMTTSLNFTLYSGTRRFPWKENDVRRLSKLCGQFLRSNYSIDIIRIAEEPRRAFRDGVTHSPTVFLELPCGRKHKIGGFVETEKYLRLNHNTADEIRATGKSSPSDRT